MAFVQSFPNGCIPDSIVLETQQMPYHITLAKSASLCWNQCLTTFRHKGIVHAAAGDYLN